MSFKIFTGEKFIVTDYKTVVKYFQYLDGEPITAETLTIVLNNLEEWCSQYGYTLLGVDFSDAHLFIFRKTNMYEFL